MDSRLIATAGSIPSKFALKIKIIIICWKKRSHKGRNGTSFSLFTITTTSSNAEFEKHWRKGFIYWNNFRDCRLWRFRLNYFRFSGPFCSMSCRDTWINTNNSGTKSLLGNQAFSSTVRKAPQRVSISLWKQRISMWLQPSSGFTKCSPEVWINLKPSVKNARPMEP